MMRSWLAYCRAAATLMPAPNAAPVRKLSPTAFQSTSAVWLMGSSTAWAASS